MIGLKVAAVYTCAVLVSAALFLAAVALLLWVLGVLS